jgi:hypothetical protein
VAGPAPDGQLSSTPLESFAAAQGLRRSIKVSSAGELVARSREVAGLPATTTWAAFQGVLPGGLRGTAGEVDGVAVVRTRAPDRARLHELDIRPTGRRGHDAASSPFALGAARSVPIDRRRRARVHADADPAAVEHVAAELRAWLAHDPMPFAIELFDSWLTVTAAGPAIAETYEALCAALTRIHRIVGPEP